VPGRQRERRHGHRPRAFRHPGEASNSTKPDHAFEGLIPPPPPSELADPHRSLDAAGCRDALVVWQGHDVLVDGHNRLRYCREKGYPFPVAEKEFADKDEVKAYIISTQLGRRNLSPAAESYLRGKRYLGMKKQGVRTDKTSGHFDQKTTAEKLGEEFKVGEKTIRRDARFSQAVDQIVQNCGQDTRNLILAREAGLTRGGVLRLAKLKPEKQKKCLQELKESGRRPRKPRKGKRRQTITLPSQPKALDRPCWNSCPPSNLPRCPKPYRLHWRAWTEPERRTGRGNGRGSEGGRLRNDGAEGSKGGLAECQQL
jgi:hypothetical protein